jgi:hypothetical protein
MVLDDDRDPLCWVPEFVRYEHIYPIIFCQMPDPPKRQKLILDPLRVIADRHIRQFHHAMSNIFSVSCPR